MNNKTPGSDGFTIEFYHFFWPAIGPIMVDSFNYAFENGEMSISQKRGIISLIPKKDKDKKYLKNWRPISLLNNDYKIVTKALALCLEKVLPTIISANQTGYVKGRYFGESIRIIKDMMSFTKKKNIPGLAVLILKKLSILSNGATFKNALKLLTLVLNYDNGSQSCTITYQAVFWTMALPLNILI